MASGSSRCPVWQTLRVNAVDAVFEERWCLGAGERGNPATVSSHGRSAIESRCWSTPAASTRSWWCCAAPAPSDAAAGWVATIVGVDGPLVDARPAHLDQTPLSQPGRPPMRRVQVFDVNETLLDLAAMDPALRAATSTRWSTRSSPPTSRTDVPHELAVAVQFVAGEVVEDGENPFGGRRLAGAQFGVERDVGGGGGFHGGADLAFDECADEEGEELAAEDRFDAGGVAEPDRVGVLDGLEQVVAAFEVGLVPVGDKRILLGQVPVVGDQREAAVAGGVVGDQVVAGSPLDAVAGAGGAPVAGLGAGPAALLLPEALLDGLGDGDLQPAG